MDDFDFTQQAPPLQRIVQPPPLPEPFTQADSLRLQRLQQGLSSAQQQVDSGELTPDQGHELSQGILRMQAPLRQRQQQARQQGMQQMQQQAMQQAALQESIAHAHAITQTQNFPQTVASYTDPLTGETAHFYQPERGKWEPIEFVGAEAAPEEPAPEEAPPGPDGPGLERQLPPEPIGSAMAAPGAAGGGAFGRLDQMRDVAARYPEAAKYLENQGREPADERTQGAPLDVDAARQQTDEMVQAARRRQAERAGAYGSEDYPEPPPNPTDAQMRLWASRRSGGKTPLSLEDYAQALRDDYARGIRSPGRATVPLLGGYEAERAGVAQAGGGGGGAAAPPVEVSEHELGVLRDRAEKAVQKVQMPVGGIRSPQQQRAMQSAIQQRQKSVDALVQHWSGALLKSKQSQVDRGARSQEAQRVEGARADEHRRQEEAAKAMKEMRAQRQKAQQSDDKERRSAYRHHAGAVRKEMPGADPAKVKEEIERRMKEEDDFVRPREEGQGGGGAGAEDEAKAIEQELARRAALEKVQDAAMQSLEEHRRKTMEEYEKEKLRKAQSSE